MPRRLMGPVEESELGRCSVIEARDSLRSRMRRRLPCAWPIETYPTRGSGDPEAEARLAVVKASWRREETAIERGVREAVLRRNQGRAREIVWSAISAANTVAFQAARRRQLDEVETSRAKMLARLDALMADAGGA